VAKHWTKTDINRVRALLQELAARMDGGFAAIARECKTATRQAVSKWGTKGRIAVPHHPTIIRLAHDLLGRQVTPADLHPAGRSTEDGSHE
jgi:hypothetical protein